MSTINKKIIYILLIVLYSCSIEILRGQQILSKEEAVTIALENNLGIKVATNNLEVASNNKSILNNSFLPTIIGNAGASIDKQNTEGELANGQVRTANGVETRRYNASIGVSYILFNGFNRHYNYKQFKERYQLSELEVRQVVENTLLQLFSVYFEVARLEENVINLKNALTISKARLKRAKYRFEYGQNTGLDILNAEVDVNTDSIDVLNAEQQLRNTKRDLNVILNREITTSFVADTLVTFLPELTIEAIAADAKQNNVTMQIMEQNMAIANLQYKVAKSNYLPTVGLTGAYGWNEATNNNPLAFTVSSNASGLTGGINFSWNIFDGGKTVIATENSKIAFKNQELLKKQTILEIERLIENTFDAYKNSLFVLQAQEKNLQTNLNNFNRTKEYYKMGQITSLDFRQAQLNLLNAKLAKSTAKYNAKLAELKMLQVSGQLLNTDF